MTNVSSYRAVTPTRLGSTQSPSAPIPEPEKPLGNRVLSPEERASIRGSFETGQAWRIGFKYFWRLNTTTLPTKIADSEVGHYVKAFQSWDALSPTHFGNKRESLPAMDLSSFEGWPVSNLAPLFARAKSLGHPVEVSDWSSVAREIPPNLEGARLMLRLAKAFGKSPAQIPFHGAPLAEFRAQDRGPRFDALREICARALSARGFPLEPEGRLHVQTSRNDWMDFVLDPSTRRVKAMIGDSVLSLTHEELMDLRTAAATSQMSSAGGEATKNILEYLDAAIEATRC